MADISNEEIVDTEAEKLSALHKGHSLLRGEQVVDEDKVTV